MALISLSLTVDELTLNTAVDLLRKCFNIDSVLILFTVWVLCVFNRPWATSKEQSKVKYFLFQILI